MPFTHQSRNPGELIRSTDWNTMGDEVERLGDAKVDRAGNDTIAGALGIRGDLSVGTANSGATLRVLKRQEDGGDVAHGALVLGNDGDASASLRLGYSSQFSWLQGLGRQTLALNPRGGDVGVGTDRPRSRLSVAGGLSVGAGWAAGQAAPASSLIVEGNVGVGMAAPAHKLEVLGGNDIALFQSTTNNAYVRVATSEGLGNRVEVANRPGGRLALWVGSGVDAVNVLRDGRTGIGTTDPQDRLEVRGNLRLLTDANPLRITSGWSGFTDLSPNHAEISNDTTRDKRLMIVGNKSGGGNVRRVGIWDELTVHGKLFVDTDLQIGAGKTLSAPGRLHISGDETLYLLNKTGVIVGKAWGGNGNLTVEGNLGVSGGLSFGNQTRQMLNLWGTEYGAGVQGSTTYFRTGGHFAFYRGGAHNDAELNGGGGAALMVLRGDNAGIGTTEPRDRLEVRGNIRLSGDGNLFAAAGPENLRLIRGTVRSDGLIDSGAGFSVIRRGVGVYQIYFSGNFAGRPAVSVTQIYPGPDDWGVGGDTRDNAILTGIGPDSFKVSTGGGDGSRSDRWFSFIVMGPR